MSGAPTMQTWRIQPNKARVGAAIRLGTMESEHAPDGASSHGAADLGWANPIISALLSAAVVFAVLYRLGGSIMVCSVGSSIVATGIDLGTGHRAGTRLADHFAVVNGLVVAVIGFLATLDLAGVTQSWAARHVPAHTLGRTAVVVGACVVARCAVLLGGYVVDRRARRSPART